MPLSGLLLFLTLIFAVCLLWLIVSFEQSASLWDLNQGCVRTNPLLEVLSTIHHFFAIDESQARGPSVRVRLSKVAALM
jgi:hypothetical protein